MAQMVPVSIPCAAKPRKIFRIYLVIRHKLNKFILVR